MSMIRKFKDFLAKSHVIDLAGAVVMGGAFTAIINSVVNDLLMPLVGMISGGINIKCLSLTVGNAHIAYGAFLQASFNFIVVAWVLFSIIQMVSEIRKFHI